MEIRQYLTDSQKESLAIARKTYGNSRQILVSNEELCELAAVCAKFPRYDDPSKAVEELHSKAIDEVADVLIILDHVISIFELSDQDILSRIQGKVDRLNRWLAKSTSMEQTTLDREVIEHYKPCSDCIYFGDYKNVAPGGICVKCVQDNWSQRKPKEGAE